MTDSSGSSFPTQAHYEMLTRSQRHLSDAAQKIGKAHAAGIDVQEFREGHQYLSDTINRFLSIYYPDQLMPPSGTGLPRLPE